MGRYAGLHILSARTTSTPSGNGSGSPALQSVASQPSGRSTPVIGPGQVKVPAFRYRRSNSAFNFLFGAGRASTTCFDQSKYSRFRCALQPVGGLERTDRTFAILSA